MGIGIKATATAKNDSEVTLDEVIDYLKIKKQKAIDENGTSEITLTIPNMLLKRINKRLAKRKISNIEDYFIQLVFLDLENR